MPVYYLPSTREEDELAAYLMKDRQKKPCWLCKRESRKTYDGYMCWDCQELRPVWEWHLKAISEAEYARKSAAYTGVCMSCAMVRVVGNFECGPCRAEWGV